MSVCWWGVGGGARALAPHERLPEILVVPREKTPTGAALLSRSGGEKGLRGSGAGTLGVPLGSSVLAREGAGCGSVGVHGIFQARILEWVDISFSRRFSRLRD